LIQKKIIEDNLEVGTNLPSEQGMAAEKIFLKCFHRERGQKPAD